RSCPLAPSYLLRVLVLVPIAAPSLANLSPPQGPAHRASPGREVYCHRVAIQLLVNKFQLHPRVPLRCVRVRFGPTIHAKFPFPSISISISTTMPQCHQTETVWLPNGPLLPPTRTRTRPHPRSLVRELVPPSRSGTPCKPRPRSLLPSGSHPTSREQVPFASSCTGTCTASL